MSRTKPERLTDIQKRVAGGQRLSLEDGRALWEADDLLLLGRLARHAKETKSGDHAYFNVNRHINLTNVCVSRCKFCAFSCDKDDPEAYLMTVDEAVRRAVEALPLGITELHIVSGMHPDMPFSYYVDVIRACREALPDIHIQAFTAIEIDYFTQLSGRSVGEVLETLKDAGLGSMPGGGAEVFSGRVREAVCPLKAGSNRWLEVMRTAHELGIRSNATMLYGHIETLDERLEHLDMLRCLQDKTGGFQSFIPLPFHPENTGLSDHQKPTAFENLKMVALSRLMLDNFDHIKAFWIMLGLKVAQLSLDFGADDLDGTVVEERITHAAGATTDQAISRDGLLELIREARRTPVERDTLYNVIKVHAGPPEARREEERP